MVSVINITRTKRGGHGNELDLYLSRKHDELLATTLEPGSYKKTSSLVIVDGFAVQITDDQVLYISYRTRYSYDQCMCVLDVLLGKILECH